MQEEGPNFEAYEEGEICTRSKLFELKSAFLYYTSAQGNYQKDPRDGMLSHKSVIEIAVHLCRLGMLWLLMSLKMDCHVSRLIPTFHLELTSEMNSILRPLQKR